MPDKNKTGVELIAEERQRQIEKEGWTADYDDNYQAKGDLASAGACYALDYAGAFNPSANWPWEDRWWKPTPNDPVRQLVKAGALIAAEIDRLQRSKDDAK